MGAIKLTEEQKAAKKLEKELLKEKNRIESEKNQKPIKSLKITIEWKKSRTWGSNPSAFAEVSFVDGSFLRTESKYKASGCGYDKESTVVAEICNDYMLYMLHNLSDKTNTPYGISVRDEKFTYFNGGVGISCYYRVADFLGGKLEKIASGNTFDVYLFSF